MAIDADLSANASPFESIVSHKSDADRLAEILGSLRSQLRVDVAGAIADRLSEIGQAGDEDSIPINPQSLGGLFVFLTMFDSLKLPELSIAPNGDVYARWRQSARRKLSIQFVTARYARVILFSPSLVEPDYDSYLVDTIALDSIVDDLSRFQVRDLLEGVR